MIEHSVNGIDYTGYLGDIRLEMRGNSIAEMMVNKQTVVLNRLASDRSSLVGSCRFFSNDYVTIDDLVREGSDRCRKASEGLHVLAIHDSSEINYRKHAGKLSREDKGLGPVGNNIDIGFYIHPVLALDAKDGFPLGIPYVHIWNRQWDRVPKDNTQCKKLSIEDKESYKWIDSAIKSKDILSDASSITFIADREADIYEEFITIPDNKTHLLIRSMHDRKLYDQKDTLYSYISYLPISGTYKLEIRKSQKKRIPRIALMEVRYGKVKIRKPSNLTGYPEYVELYVVEARENEQTVPPGESPVLWRLLTTHKINFLIEAIQIIYWYSLRWQIEQIFRTIKKQGLNIEDSQMETGSSLKKLSVIALNASVRIMQLVQEREGISGRPGTIAFSPEELMFMIALKATYEGKTEKQKNPFQEYSLAWAAWFIARIGGWKGYRRASPPGPITMRRGLEIFSTLFAGWQLGRMASSNEAPFTC
jgi:hypothetical protein